MKNQTLAILSVALLSLTAFTTACDSEPLEGPDRGDQDWSETPADGDQSGSADLDDNPYDPGDSDDGGDSSDGGDSGDSGDSGSGDGDPNEGPRGDGELPGDEPGTGDLDPIDDIPDAGPLTTCELPSDCAGDEACTQGGHCVNITGQRDATAVLQADFDALTDPVGVGVPYKLPDNAILRLNDLDGDGVALRISTPIIFDGAGSLFVLQNDKIAIEVAPTAERSLLRDFRIDPSNSSGVNESVGIDVRAHGVRLDNIFFWRLGTGVRAYSEGSERLNSQQWSRLVFRSVHHYATDLRGDVNHSTFKGLEVIGSAGIYDGSNAGNTYIGATMEGTHTHSMILDGPNAHNTVLGTYLEEGDPLIQSASDFDLHVGGNSIDRIIGPAERLGNHASSLTFRDPSSGLLVSIPGNEDSAIGWTHPSEGDWWYLKYFTASNMLRWGFSFNNTNTAPFFWTGDEHSSGAGNLIY